MTDIQKIRVHEMQRLGFSSRRIATALSLPEGTVKSHLARAVGKGTLPAFDPAPHSSCRQCGAALDQVPSRKRRAFCSKTCRQRWWNSHLYLVDRSPKAIHHLTCPACNKTFTVYGSARRIYCSHPCYISSRYHKEDSDGR
ncbi:MAG: RNA polymerase subunit sigma-70 [Spirochaetae bacterium HGW-Spirochaetae-8]|jgi:endogenous inhibitor of DNA gyrase (YacG/DUF329 family)|nr:MAG: RNA polymerase subunit sigma-70 [Spirochaetae bacterium HGW-Spirochaetae-8]